MGTVLFTGCQDLAIDHIDFDEIRRNYYVKIFRFVVNDKSWFPTLIFQLKWLVAMVLLKQISL